MQTAYYDNKPAIYEAVGNGSFVYRWGIEEVAVEHHTDADADETATATMQWKCFEVVVWATVTREKLTEAVITARWPTNYEEKLINDYNAATLGVLGEEYIERYRTFLSERKALKEQVAADCLTLKIA